MPMRLADYPPDWRQISKRIREERAGGRCECAGSCGVDHGGRCDELNHTPARHFKGTVVLTVAHLNHERMDVRDENLAAWCQRCHNRYDAPHRAETRAATLAARTRRERHEQHITRLSSVIFEFATAYDRGGDENELPKNVWFQLLCQRDDPDPGLAGWLRTYLGFTFAKYAQHDLVEALPAARAAYALLLS